MCTRRRHLRRDHQLHHDVASVGVVSPSYTPARGTSGDRGRGGHHHEWRLVAIDEDLARCAEPRLRRPGSSRRPPLGPHLAAGASDVRLRQDLVNVFLADPQRRLVRPRNGAEIWDVTAATLGTFPQRPRPTAASSSSPHTTGITWWPALCTATPRGSRTSGERSICQAGLVVRRRRIDLPGGPQGEVARALRQHAVARSKRAAVERRLAAMRPANGGAVRSAVLENRLRSLRSAEQDARDLVLQWVQSGGQVRCLEGWIPTGTGRGGQSGTDAGLRHRAAADRAGGHGGLLAAGRGAARDAHRGDVPAQPARPGPHPSGPRRDRPDHLLRVVPTGSSDVNDAGHARFNDHSCYEIRCFVRRHRPECPRSGPQCSCPITWSEPTADLSARLALRSGRDR